MAALSGPIIADGTYTLATPPGRYAFGAAGTWGAGSLAVNWLDAAGNVAAFPDSPLTANGGLELTLPGGTLQLVLSGSTDPVLTVTLTRL